MMDWWKVFNQPVKIIATGQGDDYTTGCLLDNSNKMLAIDLNKQPALDADPKPIQ